MAENDKGASNEETTQIKETEEGAVVEVSLTRGTGTYDKDYVKGTLEKGSLEEIQNELEEFRELLQEQAEWSREVQPQLDVDEIVELAEDKGITDELFRELYEITESEDQ